MPFSSLTPIARPFFIIIFSTPELVIILPPFVLRYFANAKGRFMKPPLTILLPSSCIILEKRYENDPPPASSGESPTNAAKVPNKTLIYSDSKYSFPQDRID
ncbi:MAG TPA: hypothetical protein VIY98_01970 [Nitrososphaeraceae archaeon]